MLSYVSVGDPAGVPLISNHGGLSSGFDVVPADVTAKRLGLRVISPDRPGIAGSDPAPGRTVLDWAADVAELTERLRIGRFATMGWSLGGCYAAALAYGLRDRVDKLVLVGSGIPVDWPGMAAEINLMDRVLLALGRHRSGRVVERASFAAASRIARHAPGLLVGPAGIPDPARPALTAAIADGLRHGSGVVTEYQLLDRPWGFELSQLTVPTDIWHGDRDDYAPVQWAGRLHNAIRGSHLFVVPGASHFLWYDAWDDILGRVAAH